VLRARRSASLRLEWWSSALRDGGAAALASGCSAVEARHLGGRAGLVDENELLGIEIKLAVEPGRAGHFHIAALLLGRMRRLFLSVIRRRLKKRQSVPIPALTLRSFSFVRSSARVMSGVSVTRPRMTSL
jgi:hypothetical protein